MPEYTLGEALLGTAVDLDGLFDGIDKARAAADTGFGEIAGILSGALTTAAVGVGVALAGVGIAAGKMAYDSEQAIKGLQAQLGLTREEAEKLGAVGDQVWAKGFGENLDEAYAMVGRVRQELKDLNGQELQNVTTGAAAIAQTFEQDFGSVVNTVATLRQNFPGLTEVQALDMITKGFQNGLDASGDYLDSLREYAPQFNALGSDAGQFFSVLETGLSGGVLGVDKAGDLLKEMRLRVSEETDAVRESLQMIGVDADGFFEKLRDGSMSGIDAFQVIQSGLARVKDPVAQNTAAVALLGTQWEDLGPAAVLAIDTANSSIADMAGATDGLYVQYTSLGDAFEQGSRQAMLAIRPLGDALLELVNAAMPYVMQGFAWFRDQLPGIISVARTVIQQFATGTLPALQRAWQTIAPVVVAAGSAVVEVAKIFVQIASAAVGWGANIANQLANGIMQAAAAVVRALSYIGKVISYWLKPHSPPALLPDLDTWGTEAANVYMDGWTKADFQALDELGGSIKDVLQSLVDAGDLQQQDLIPLLFGSRDAIANAINEIREVGTVSEASFNAIVKAAGPAGEKIAPLVRTYFELEAATRDLEKAQADATRADEDLTRARAELDAITQRYAETLAPLNKELAAIQREQSDIRDQQRIAKLQEELASGELDANEARLAQLEIMSIEKQRQIRDIKDEQTAAEDAQQVHIAAAQAAKDEADQRVKAAQDYQSQIQNTLQAQQAQLQADRERISLLKEQRDLQDQLAQQAAAAAGAGGGGGIGGGGPALPELGELPDLDQMPEIELPDLGPAIEQLSKVGDAVDTVSGAVQGAITGFNSFLDIISGVVGFLSNNALPVLSGIAAMILYTMVPAWFAQATAAGAAAIATAAAMAPVILTVAAIGLAVGLLVATWQNDWGGIRTTIVTFWEGTAKPVLSELARWLGQVVTAAITTLAGFWTNTLQPALNAVWTFISTNILPILSSLVDVYFAALGVAIGVLAGFWTDTLWPAIQKVAEYVSANVMPILGALVSVGIAAVQTALAALANVWTTVLWPAIKKVADFITTSVMPVVKNLVDLGLKLIELAVVSLAAAWETQLKPAIEVVGTFIGTTIMPILKDLVDQGLAIVKTSLATLADVWTQTLKPALTALGNLLKDVLKPAIAGVNDAFDGMKKGLGWVSDKIEGLIGWVQKAIDKIKELNRVINASPTIPHSPPLWAQGLTMVAEALENAHQASLTFIEGLEQGEISVINNAFKKLKEDVESLRSALENEGFAGNLSLTRSRLEAEKALQDKYGKTRAEEEKKRLDEIANHRRELENATAEAEIKAVEALNKEREAIDKDYLKREADLQEKYNKALERGDYAALSDIQAEFDALETERTAQRDAAYDIYTTTLQKLYADQDRQMSELDSQQKQAQEALNRALHQGEAIYNRYQSQLAAAEQEAMKLQEYDPKLASQYFALRQKQIFELAELERDYADSNDAQEKASLDRQMQLIKSIHVQEQQAFDRDAQARIADLQKKADAIGSEFYGAVDPANISWQQSSAVNAMLEPFRQMIGGGLGALFGGLTGPVALSGIGGTGFDTSSLGNYAKLLANNAGPTVTIRLDGDSEILNRLIDVRIDEYARTEDQRNKGR